MSSPSRAPGEKRSRPVAAPRGTRSWLWVVKAYNLCEAVMTARLAAIGVRVGEHEVLANLATAPGMTQQALAARCFVAKSGISMVLAQMEAEGLVRRDADPQDARVKRLSLTPAGEALARRSMQVQGEVVAAMAEAASHDELDAVAAVMERLCARLEALREASPALPRQAARRARQVRR